MFNSIRTYYNDDDISQRKQQYYTQILDSKSRSISPFKSKQEMRQPIQPVNNSHIIIAQNYKIPSLNGLLVNKNQQIYQREQNTLKQQDLIKNSQVKFDRSIVSNNFKQSSIKSIEKLTQLDKVLRQRQQLQKRLQMATLGLPYQQCTNQAELISNNYILPHYKSQKTQTIQLQQLKIKQLTNQMLQNQIKINRMKNVRKTLAERVDIIRKIDKQIFQQLDEDRTQQIENYLRLAKVALAEGQSQDKIINILKKILY